MVFSNSRRRTNKFSASVSNEGLLGSRPVTIPTTREAGPRFAAELSRCRRYEHRLTVLALAPDHPAVVNGHGGGNGSAPHAGIAADAARVAFILLGWLLHDSVRASDIVAYCADSHLYLVVLPETDGTQGRQAAWRIGRRFQARSSIALRVGAAEFPADGFTVDDLVDHARHAWQCCPLADPLLVAAEDRSSA